jgi:hypothetical protein
MLQDDSQAHCFNRSRSSSHSMVSASNDSTDVDSSGPKVRSTMPFQPSRRRGLSSLLKFRRQHHHCFDGPLARNEPNRRQPRSPPPPAVAVVASGAAIVYQMQDLIQLEPQVYLVTARSSPTATVNQNMVIVRHRRGKGRDDELRP